MRTYSTPESALNGEITKLAILECVASVAIYVALGLYLGTFRYLALAIVFAPLMLFRTEASSIWGLAIYEKYLAKFDREYTFSDVVAVFVVAPVMGTMIRIVATLYWAIRHPLQTLKATPQNWLRQSLCTDFFHPPEVVPLEATRADPTLVPTFTDALRGLREEESHSTRLFLLLVATPFLLIGWLPSLMYRVSFKATALVYTPFVWVAHATLRNPLSCKARLERITKGELEKVRRWLSGIILMTLAGKVALVYGWVDRAFVESKFPSQKIVSSLVILDGWPWWQVTLGADAALTFFLLFYADAALARVEGERTWGEGFVQTTVSSVSFLRAALGLVTISHFFHVALLSVAPESVRQLLAF